MFWLWIAIAFIVGYSAGLLSASQDRRPGVPRAKQRMPAPQRLMVLACALIGFPMAALVIAEAIGIRLWEPLRLFGGLALCLLFVGSIGYRLLPERLQKRLHPE